MNPVGPSPARTIATVVVFVGIVVALAACAPGEAPTPTAVPTQVLIPSTATDTPSPIPPTPTSPALPGPADVVATQAASTDPTQVVDRELVSHVIADLADHLGISADSIELIRLEAATWNNIDLGCGDESVPDLELAIEGYRLVLVAEDQTYEYHTDTRARIRRCPQTGVGGGTTSVLLEADPIAAELVALAQRRLGEALDLSTRRIRVVDVVSLTWTDSSLGCPQTNQEYVPVTIEGYRIVLAAGEDEYVFHTDIERLVPCDPEDENLPEDLDVEPAG